MNKTLENNSIWTLLVSFALWISSVVTNPGGASIVHIDFSNLEQFLNVLVMLSIGSEFMELGLVEKCQVISFCITILGGFIAMIAMLPKAWVVLVKIGSGFVSIFKK